MFKASSEPVVSAGDLAPKLDSEIYIVRKYPDQLVEIKIQRDREELRENPYNLQIN